MHVKRNHTLCGIKEETATLTNNPIILYKLPNYEKLLHSSKNLSILQSRLRVTEGRTKNWMCD